MRGYLTGFLLLLALGGHAQKRREAATDSATLSFMQWRLGVLRAQLFCAQPWNGKSRLNLFAHPLSWRWMPWLSYDTWLSTSKCSAAGIDTLVQQRLGLIHDPDTALHAKAMVKCLPPQKQLVRLKPLFTQQDLLAIGQSFGEQPILLWPAAFPGFRHRKKYLPACCAFTQPVCCANGQIVLQWEYVFGEERLAIYQRVSAHEWCLLSQPHRIMY